MKTNWTIRTLQLHRKKICRAETPAAIGMLLNKEVFHLQLLARQPPYHLFSIPKRDGTLRWIEDPRPPLKEVQRALNRYLQGVYYFQRTDAAFGFVVNAKNDALPRNIFTNAQQHCGKAFLLNLDLEDFFYQVKADDVTEICLRPPFQFNADAAALISGLTTHQGRLPMGAPSSPILSNFAVIALDEDLLRFSRGRQLTYTRYADDLTFSSHHVIEAAVVEGIRNILQSHRLAINTDKLKMYNKGEPREVTGLQVTDQVALPDDYLPRVEAEIQKLRNVMEVNQRFNTLQSDRQLNRLKSMIKGHINFAATVMGEQHQAVEKLNTRFQNALDPPEDFASASWLEFDYLDV